MSKSIIVIYLCIYLFITTFIFRQFHNNLNESEAVRLQAGEIAYQNA